MERNGMILEGVGGRYRVRITDPDSPLFGKDCFCLPKGVFRHEKISPLPGDRVRVLLPEDAESKSNLQDGNSTAGGAVIAEILPRKNLLIRPPVSNLDTLFVTFASALPEPVPETVDKLTAIAEQNRILPVIVITKSELNPESAASLAKDYRLTPYPVFLLSAVTGEGLDEFRAFLKEALPQKISAFAGASGIGKSTLLNALFPDLLLETAEISRKTERGRHTTRKVTLFPIDHICSSPIQEGFLADTPGFSLIDFVHFDFFDKEDLPYNFPEFRPYLGTCRYTKCTHTKEEGCKIIEAVAEGKIAPSRHRSYTAIFDVLKQKHKWDKPR